MYALTRATLKSPGKDEQRGSFVSHFCIYMNKEVLPSR